MDGRRIMWATKAFHRYGDISRDNEDLCLIGKETPDYFIGSWVTGFGFIDVKFPKSTTRNLTEEERVQWRGKNVVAPWGVVPLDVDHERPLIVELGG